MSPIELPKIYNPSNQTPTELIENFVVRTKIFQDIYEEIKNSKMKYPEQHYIIQGIRGQGKTTLLLRIYYEINNDEKLKHRIIPIIFNEEQYNISRLYKLWETTGEYLDECGEIIGLYDEMQKFPYDDDYEYRCFRLLEHALKKNKKKIVLFIDNIDSMFNKFSRQEHHRLREVFIESAELRVIGASSVSLEFHYDYGEPFYQFFRMPQLNDLTSDETRTLLLKLGERYKSERVREILRHQPGRVEALRRITGGVIRTIILLFEIFVDDRGGNAFRDLEKILDSVSPLYKHRMDNLPPQQQEIIDYIALSWDAVSTMEIAKRTKIESKAVSAQLRQLEKYNIVEKVKTNTKNYLYRIHERFFNIWYLMRLGRKESERRVRFLVEFLQIWCDEKESSSVMNNNRLYETEFKDPRKAEQYYFIAAEKEDSDTMHNLARVFFKEKLNKQKALKYADTAYELENTILTSHTYAMILLWNNEIKKAYEISKVFLNDRDSFSKFTEEIGLFLMFLIAKKQYQLTLKIFNENPHELKDRFKPVYYALMYFMQDEYPNEYRKMGSELKQTVEEILLRIQQLAEDYR